MVLRWLSAFAIATLCACGSTTESDSTENTPMNDLSSIELANSLDCPELEAAGNHPLDAELSAHLDTIVSKGFPGVSAVVYTPEGGVWRGTAGKADLGSGIPVQTCHAFFSGSIAKTYTATVAMQLVESGLLSLDDPIAPHLPISLRENLPNAGVATVRQLLNHTAGMPDHDDEEQLDAYLEMTNGELPSAEDQLAYLYDNAPRFTPGEQAAYSSAHTVALALVVEQLAGEHHGQLINRNIVSRLGLNNTWYKMETGLPHPVTLVTGYISADGVLEDATDAAVNYANSSEGDAGIMATADDYYQFLRALMEGELLTHDTLSTMQETTPVYEANGVVAGYAHGLISTKVNGNIVKIGHSGATLGGLAHAYYYPSIDSYVVLLTNVLPEDDDDMAQYWGSAWVSTSGTDAIGAIELLIQNHANGA